MTALVRSILSRASRAPVRQGVADFEVPAVLRAAAPLRLAPGTCRVCLDAARRTMPPCAACGGQA